jgi:hypothetical protein
MAPSKKKPGPLGLGHDSGGDLVAFARDLALGVLSRNNPICLPGPIGICIRPRDLLNALAKPSAPPKVTNIDEIIFHIHMEIAKDRRNYNEPRFENWFRGQLLRKPTSQLTPDESPWETPWERIGIQVSFHTDDGKAAVDFESSLQNPAAAVVYWGHALQDENDVLHSMGLHIPVGSKSYMSSAVLRDKLTRAKAPLIVIASCDSKYAVTGEKPPMINVLVEKRDKRIVRETSYGSPKLYFKDSGPQPVIVVTDSGTDLVSNSLNFAAALGVFFASLAGIRVDGDWHQNTLELNEPNAKAMNVTDALAACNKFMGTDSLVLAHGDDSFRIFSS